MTTFLHAMIHRERLRRFSLAPAHPDRPLRQPLLAFCPTCGESYFTEQEPNSGSRRQSLETWEAVARLDGECPDHPHHFAVGPYPGRD